MTARRNKGTRWRRNTTMVETGPAEPYAADHATGPDESGWTHIGPVEGGGVVFVGVDVDADQVAVAMRRAGSDVVTVRSSPVVPPGTAIAASHPHDGYWSPEPDGPPGSYAVRAVNEASPDGGTLAYMAPDGHIVLDRNLRPYLDLENVPPDQLAAAQRYIEQQIRRHVSLPPHLGHEHAHEQIFWYDAATIQGGFQYAPPQLEQPWSRPDADVTGDIQRAIGSMQVTPEMIGRPDSSWAVQPGPDDRGHAEFAAGLLGQAHPLCPEHGCLMVHSDYARWFACPGRTHGHSCRYVLTDDDISQHGDQASFRVRSSFPCCAEVDEFTGAMSEAEHQRIRREMGLTSGEPPFPQLTEEEWVRSQTLPDRPGEGSWQNRNHP